MKTLYKSSRRIAAAIVGTLVLSTSAAIALTRDAGTDDGLTAVRPEAESLGRFVVTPKHTHFVPAPESLGRFVVSRHSSFYVAPVNANA